jgi:transposase
MAHTTENQFNVQWDVLQNSTSDNNSAALLDPLSDIMNNDNFQSNEPAVLSSQSVSF